MKKLPLELILQLLNEGRTIVREKQAAIGGYAGWEEILKVELVTKDI